MKRSITCPRDLLDYPQLHNLLACKRRTFLPVEVSLIFDTLGAP